ncbi:Polyketide synthase-nonribosomal peptide synthetase 3 [Seiridium cupressi]
MIAEVGYLHEGPEIELMLLRKGIQPLNEEKFLQVIDYGVPGPGGSSDFAQWAPMTAEAGHILTDLEPSSIRKLVEAGFDIKSGTMQDLAQRSEWVKDVPAKAVRMFTSVADAPSML